MGVSGVASASVPAFSSQRMIQPVFTSAALLEIGYYLRVFSAAGGGGIGRLAGAMDDALSSDWGTPVGTSLLCQPRVLDSADMVKKWPVPASVHVSPDGSQSQVMSPTVWVRP